MILRAAAGVRLRRQASVHDFLQVVSFMRRTGLIGDLPRVAAQRHGDKLALVTNDRELTFAALDRLVDDLAAGMMSIGVRRGDRVVLHLSNGWRWVVAYYAIARCGAIIVPANVMLTSEEIGYIVADSGASVLITASQRVATMRSLAEIRALSCVLGDEAVAGEQSIDSLLAESSPGAGTVSEPSIHVEDVAVIGYTSGTTGRPKGAVLTHRALTLNAQLTATMHGRSAQDRIFTALPCAHIYGMLILNSAVLAGATLILHEKFEADAALAAIGRYAATVVDAVPTMYYYVLSSPSFTPEVVKSLRLCTVGGQGMPLPKMQEVERRLGCPLIEGWGMTELAGMATSHPVYAPGPLGSIGIAFPHVECRIAPLDDPKGSAPPGERGELMVRGPIVMNGYWRRPDATREVLDEEGWLATGDIAYRDADGYLFVVDRKKELIITAGYNIYPSEIERVIATHPSVAMVAVGAVPHPEKGEIAAAFVVLREGASCGEGELLQLCRAHLAAYKVPRVVRFVRELPRTSSGKIRRRALADLA